MFFSKINKLLLRGEEEMGTQGQIMGYLCEKSEGGGGEPSFGGRRKCKSGGVMGKRAGA